MTSATRGVNKSWQGDGTVGWGDRGTQLGKWSGTRENSPSKGDENKSVRILSYSEENFLEKKTKMVLIYFDDNSILFGLPLGENNKP